MKIQKAGDNAQQFQIQNLTIGIDEKRAREIYDESYKIAKKDFTEEAIRVASERVKQLEDKLIPKMEAMRSGLKSFADPGFQFLLVKAQKSAAATERPVDYELLSELLVQRIQKGNDRHVRTGIHRAIEIVEDISDEALLGLTVIHSLISFGPVSSECTEVLDVLNSLYGRIIYAKLPEGTDWIEDLEILDAIRISPFGKFRSIMEYYSELLNGVITVGIRKDSQEHHDAIEILQTHGLPTFLLVENYLQPGYVRVNIKDLKILDTSDYAYIFVDRIISLPKDQKLGDHIISLSKDQKLALKSISELYSKDAQLKKDVEKKFLLEWEKRPHLVQLKDWFEKVPNSFNITSVGKVLAHANAQRCDSDLPALK